MGGQRRSGPGSTVRAGAGGIGLTQRPVVELDAGAVGVAALGGASPCADVTVFGYRLVRRFEGFLTYSLYQRGSP